MSKKCIDINKRYSNISSSYLLFSRHKLTGDDEFELSIPAAVETTSLPDKVSFLMYVLHLFNGAGIIYDVYRYIDDWCIQTEL